MLIESGSRQSSPEQVAVWVVDCCLVNKVHVARLHSTNYGLNTLSKSNEHMRHEPKQRCSAYIYT